MEELSASVKTISIADNYVDAALDFTGDNITINNAVDVVKSLVGIGLVGNGPELEFAELSPKKFLGRGIWNPRG